MEHNKKVKNKPDCDPLDELFDPHACDRPDEDGLYTLRTKHGIVVVDTEHLGRLVELASHLARCDSQANGFADKLQREIIEIAYGFPDAFSIH